MASDNHAHYSRIGFTVVIGAIAIAATLVYLGGFHDANREFLVETYYDHSVTGLSVGSPVNYLGVKIGEVRGISFAITTYDGFGADTNDYGRVCIVMALDKALIEADGLGVDKLAGALQDRVNRGLRATVASNGITGLSRIELRMMENEPDPQLPKWKSRYPLIPPSPSLIENFAMAATKLMSRLKTMDFGQVWSNVHRTADAAARTAENADVLLESSRAGIRQIVSDVGDASASLRDLSAILKDNPSLLLRASDPQPLPETQP